MEVMIDWSSSCGLVSDSRKRMQQMVSRANVPRTMMSATRLTEPEKKELDWESRREQRKLESQQFEARREKWRLEFQQLLRNIISESGGEVAEGKELSCVQEEDQQVDDAEFQNSSDFDGREPSEVANDGVEHLISVRHEEIDMELEFGKLESHEKGEPIGELLLSCNSTDHDPLEVALLSMPLPHNWNSAKVKGIDLELEQYVAEFSEYKTFSQANKLKEAECLPSARQIATVRELVVTVRNLTTLPVRIPKPMVKMKLMAQHDDDELFENNYGCESYFPFSGFPTKPTDGSSSSLFHGGVRSLYEIESHLEELKHFWPDFEVADENILFGDFTLLRNFSKMYVRGEEEFPNDVQSCEAYAKGGVLMNIEKYEVLDDRKKGYLGRGGFNISGVRGRLRIQRENGSAFVGMQHGQRRVCPFSLPSKCSFPAEAQEFLHDIVKDQHGCRFLEETFEEGTSQEGQIIFNEIIDHVAGLGFLALIKDLNGNHDVQWDLATILSVIRNLKRLLLRFPKPMVKMKLVLFSFWELLRDADMLGVLRRKVACQGAHAWGLEQGLRMIASKVLPSSAKETMTVRDALNSALDEEISAADSKVYVMGEEVGEYQGAHKITKGLLDNYGPEKRGCWIKLRLSCWNKSWCSISGIRVGAAYYSPRPVIELMTFNFTMQAIDHPSYMSSDQISMPIVLIDPNGAADGKIKHENLAP